MIGTIATGINYYTLPKFTILLLNGDVITIK